MTHEEEDKINNAIAKTHFYQVECQIDDCDEYPFVYEKCSFGGVYFLCRDHLLERLNND